MSSTDALGLFAKRQLYISAMAGTTEPTEGALAIRHRRCIIHHVVPHGQVVFGVLDVRELVDHVGLGAPRGRMVLHCQKVVPVEPLEKRLIFGAGCALGSKTGLRVGIHQPDEEALEGSGELLGKAVTGAAARAHAERQRNTIVSQALR